jgi:hypothetical protein
MRKEETDAMRRRISTRKGLSPVYLLLILLAGALVSALPALAGPGKPVPVPSAPKDMTFTGLRGVQYCEVWLISGTPETGISGDYYNTSNLNNRGDQKDTCPCNLWDKVNAKKLKAEYKVTTVYKNGPRGWTMDSITIPVGPVQSFEGLKTRWWGKGVLPKGAKFKAGVEPYKPLKSHRKSTFIFQKGKPVFILEDPDGTPWVMQAFSKIIDPNLTYDSLKNLGAKLKLPPGWKYRVAVLDKDLVISTPQGYNWIVQDNLQNTYDACKEGASNYKP